MKHVCLIETIKKFLNCFNIGSAGLWNIFPFPAPKLISIHLINVVFEYVSKGSWYIGLRYGTLSLIQCAMCSEQQCRVQCSVFSAVRSLQCEVFRACGDLVSSAVQCIVGV